MQVKQWSFKELFSFLSCSAEFYKMEKEHTKSAADKQTVAQARMHLRHTERFQGKPITPRHSFSKCLSPPSFLRFDTF